MYQKCLKTIIVLIVILVLVFSLPALADDNKTTIEELGINLTLPEQGFILNRSITADDPYLSDKETTAEEISAKLAAANIYLEYINEESGYKLDVIKYNLSPTDESLALGERTDEEINELAEAMIANIDPNNISYLTTEIKGVKYILFNYQYQEQDQDVFVRAYYTAGEDRELFFCWYSTGTQFSEEIASQITAEMESITYSEQTAVPGQYVDQLYMYITMPDNAFLTSRDMTEDAPILVYYSSTKDEFLAGLEARNVYLSYFNPIGYQIDLYMTPMANDTSPETHDFGDMDQLSESQLDRYAEQTSNSLAKNEGVEISSYQVINNGNQTFVTFDYVETTAEETYYVKSYHTYINDQDIFIDLYSYGEPLTEDMLSQMDEVIASISFLPMEGMTAAGLEAADIGKILRQEVSSPSSDSGGGLSIGGFSLSGIYLFGLSGMWLLIIGGAILIAIILIVILVVKKAKKRKRIQAFEQTTPISMAAGGNEPGTVAEPSDSPNPSEQQQDDD